MLSKTRLDVYVNAYIIRQRRGEKMEDIDNYYLNLNRITKEDINQIHEKLDYYQYINE